jgi:hypothetical protein
MVKKEWDYFLHCLLKGRQAMLLTDALADTGEARLVWDMTIVTVSEDEEEGGYTVAYAISCMPAHSVMSCATLTDVEEELADSFLPPDVAKNEWEPVDEE